MKHAMSVNSALTVIQTESSLREKNFAAAEYVLSLETSLFPPSSAVSTRTLFTATDQPASPSRHLNLSALESISDEKGVTMTAERSIIEGTAWP